ncbi:MAG: type II toxin-antitoxin system VapC family toxin [Verrucomicrobiota bacterium]
MGLTLTDSTVLFFDTAPFIYLFEKTGKFSAQVTRLLDSVYDSEAQIVTSLITYIEINTAPAKAGNDRVKAKYREYFTNSEGVVIQPLNLAIAEETIRFRADYNLKTPDAIQLATAKYCGADFVITNDHAWRRISELDIILVSDL